ncbi:3024_t:CDS:2, partial [Funneliformis geosporum]
RIRIMYNVDKYFDFDNQQSVKTDKKKQQKQILLTVLLVGLGYYFFIYLPEEENKKRIWELPINSWADREVSKIRSTLIRKYQEDASIFPDGDRNTNFSFSRSATYTIHFPPSLQEYYEKAQEEEIDSDYEQFQKPTIEKVLDTRLTNIVNKIEEKMDDVLDELETSRIEGRKEITD